MKSAENKDWMFLQNWLPFGVKPNKAQPSQLNNLKKHQSGYNSNGFKDYELQFGLRIILYTYSEDMTGNTTLFVWE